MWRYDEPQFARYRSFYQWNVEIYGSSGGEADAETILIGIDILEAFGLKDFEVRISNRKLIEGFLESAGVYESLKLENVMRVIDKKRKLSEADLKKEFKRYNLDDRQVSKIMKFIEYVGRPSTIIKDVKESLPHNDKVKEGLAELTKLVYILQERNRIKHCVLDMSIVRGIGYYTGNVFECFDKGNEDVGSIWAGGRFDNLSELYGKSHPAVGIAGGMERLMISLERNELMPKNLTQVPKVFVASVNDDMRERVMEMVDVLRKKGISADFDLKNKNLSRQLEYANKLNIPYVVIIGEEEARTNKFKLKFMAEKVEKKMGLNEIIKLLK